MKLFEYASRDEYVTAQQAANVRKLSHVWVTAETIIQIARRTPYRVKSIICHGTRNGAEQKLFRQRYRRARIIGTEISPTAARFANTVQHDFHVQNPKWVGWADIVYSNSWDHSYDPVLSLTTWRDQLRKGRRLYLEHCSDDGVNVCTETDPLQIGDEEIRALLKDCGFSLVGTFKTHGAGQHVSCVYIAERPR